MSKSKAKKFVDKLLEVYKRDGNYVYYAVGLKNKEFRNELISRIDEDLFISRVVYLLKYAKAMVEDSDNYTVKGLLETFDDKIKSIRESAPKKVIKKASWFRDKETEQEELTEEQEAELSQLRKDRKPVDDLYWELNLYKINNTFFEVSDFSSYSDENLVKIIQDLEEFKKEGK